MSSFIHFGCWNEGFCETETDNNSLSRVMTALLKRDKKPSFYIVAGDNYYPTKKKKMVRKKKSLQKTISNRVLSV